mmetsp:Transcript_9780/g.9556  ORF Transcript_9780/g.9556 Transcript_9780/m.9556 type:complete len:316 (+) Transcript_9780:1443-2390(+)
MLERFHILLILRKAPCELLVLQLPLNKSVGLLQEHLAVSGGLPFVLFADLLEDFPHLLLKGGQVVLGVGAHHLLGEEGHSFPFGLLEGLLQVLVFHGDPLVDAVLEDLIEGAQAFFHGFGAFVLADVVPGVLDVGHHPVVDRLHVALRQRHHHAPVQLLPIQHLRLHPVQHLPPQDQHLFLEIGSEVGEVHVGQVLEVVFVGEGPDQGAAVSILEERFQQLPDSILLLHIVGETLLLLEGLVEVLFGGDVVSIFIDQLQSEVSDDPHEAGEVGAVLLGVHLFVVALGLDVDVLGQVDHQRQVRQRRLINAPHTVI